jgi:RNA polymerase sigma-54 factor
MAIEIKQQLRLSQQLVMTPQLQQAIKLLQLSRLELVNLVQQELTENPVLEETLESEDTGTAEVDDEFEAHDTGAVETIDTPPEREATDAEKIADVDWQNYMESNPQTSYAEARDDDERRSLESTLTRRASLAEHLEWQLQLSALTPEEREGAHWIIGNLDDDGYLRDGIEDVSRQSGIPLESLEAALAKVQGFDPPGVAARDLRECLMLQINALAIDDELVRRIVEECLDLLQKRDLRGIARTLAVPIEAVAVACRVIGNLEPWPGRQFGGDDPVYITPDIHVVRLGDDYHILLNEDGLPKLRINNLYREVLQRGNGVAKDTKDYVQDKVRSALWLIKSIHQRQRTIYKVMQSILKHQREFFDRGINYLKPLNLRDVADDIEMHESTVSRVTSNKYVNTPQGIFELKYFFNSSISRIEGDAVASESVKERIRKIIAAEDSRRPLSDQRIAEMLKAANIDIARRTVTKYREALNILSSTRRREVG